MTGLDGVEEWVAQLDLTKRRLTLDIAEDLLSLLVFLLQLFLVLGIISRSGRLVDLANDQISLPVAAVIVFAGLNDRKQTV